MDNSPFLQQVNWNPTRTGFVDPVTGALYAAIPLDANGYPIANIIPRRNTLANLLTLAGGVGEISEATDWNALVLHNGVAGQATILYCKPKRATVFIGTTAMNFTTSGAPAGVLFDTVLSDPYNMVTLNNGGYTTITAPAGATHVKATGGLGFVANATGRRQMNFRQAAANNAIPGQQAVTVNSATESPVLELASPAAVVSAPGAPVSLWGLQSSGGALATTTGIQQNFMTVEFWAE